MCGGTGDPLVFDWGSWGLSPRVRGNHRGSGCGPLILRSIPACAGEPAGRPTPRSRPGVYPRVCGGTTWGYDRATPNGGLSPRVRGNRHRIRGGPDVHGSIPACAGEPWHSWSGTSPGRVYPRVCGGTDSRTRGCQRSWGLSPRVRGNRSASLKASSRRGSIPACAGEPRTASAPSSASQVYPRVCGGTRLEAELLQLLLGLSPRVRGNR